MSDNLKDSVPFIIEASLDAQLRAVRRLRRGSEEPADPSSGHVRLQWTWLTTHS